MRKESIQALDQPGVGHPTALKANSNGAEKSDGYNRYSYNMYRYNLYSAAEGHTSISTLIHLCRSTENGYVHCIPPLVTQ
jgi:hypothetical protein